MNLCEKVSSVNAGTVFHWLNGIPACTKNLLFIILVLHEA